MTIEEVKNNPTAFAFNFSDRALAKMSDTIPGVGNTLWHVADIIRAEGLLDESEWPAPENYTETIYYASIPQDKRDKAKEFLKDWQIKYEWIDTSKASLMHHIKQAPIQIVIPGHAVCNFQTTAQIINYFDSYAPFMKQTEQIQFAMKIVLSRNNKAMTSEQVRNLYRLSFYREPSIEEIAYWSGKDLSVFLSTAIKDRASFLNQP